MSSMGNLIYSYLCDLTQCPAFLPEVNNNATSSILCLFHGLFDPEYEIRTTSTDIGAEYIASIALA